jgi:transposase
MMGEQVVMQEELFYGFSLERHVPADHLLRAIDRFVDLSAIRRHLAPFYSPIGRPSIDPELLIRMLIVGYCFGIRSERRLCEEIHLNRAYRWFCRLGLEGDVPDHSTFSKTRHGRFCDADLLRELFETVVRRCIAEGLVGGEGFAVDASMIGADAHRQRGIETAEDLNPKAKRAVAEYLATLDDAAFGAATPVEPKFVSPVDHAARWTASWGGPAVYAYCTNYLIDVGARRHRRCGALHRGAPSRGDGRQDHDRAGARRVRPLAGAADCRHRLRPGRNAELAGA